MQVYPSITFWSTLSPLPFGQGVGSPINGSKSPKADSADSKEGEEKHASKKASPKTSTIFQFPTVVNGQMTLAGVPVRPIAAALGQPIPADQVSSVASQLTTHMSNVSSPITLMSPQLMASLNPS